MTLIEDERPHNLMEALFEVRNSGRCNTLEFSCVIDTLKSIGQVEVANWLEQHQESYDKLVKQEFSQWLDSNSPYGGESIAQAAAQTTGLTMPEDSFS